MNYVKSCVFHYFSTKALEQKSIMGLNYYFKNLVLCFDDPHYLFNTLLRII